MRLRNLGSNSHPECSITVVILRYKEAAILDCGSVFSCQSVTYNNEIIKLYCWRDSSATKCIHMLLLQRI